MGTLWRIGKDAVKAALFWAIASAVMIYLWGYTGRVLAAGLGVILIISFCALRLADIVSWLRAPGGGSNSGGGPAAG